MVTAVFLSLFVLAVTGCAASSPPPAAKQETGAKRSPTKPARNDEGRSMNEESQRSIMDR
jgi:hypothetical protein